MLKIYEKCVGENEACISTIDMLHHIEVRMETLTQEQEVLHPQKVRLEIQKCMNTSIAHPKVELARVTCEKERRHREKEARLEKQRLMEAERNKVPSDANFFLKII